MPDVGTPQATWRDDPEYMRYLTTIPDNGTGADGEAAVAARDREVAATLRAKIEALPLPFDDSSNHILTVYRRSVLAVLDDVLGGDS